jgi:hypothetical protein
MVKKIEVAACGSFMAIKTENRTLLGAMITFVSVAVSGPAPQAIIGVAEAIVVMITALARWPLILHDGSK